MNQVAIGIDFGTTKTLVSFFNESSGKPETIRLGRGRDDLPTSIYISKEGEFLFGEDADDLIEFGADRYCRAFKMRLGSPSPVLTLIEGNRVVLYSAKELTGIFLKHIKERCENEVFMGKPIHRAVITRPVRFSPMQCEELKQAAENAGFSDVTFATEPEAAGYAFCRLCPDGAFKGNALVIDWGGGTLDMALVSREGDRLAAHREYIDGNTNMGGEVFDERLWNEVVSRLKAADGTDLSQESPEQRNMISRKIRYAKEILSGKSQYVLRLSCSKGVCEPIVLERSDWEKMIAPDVEQAAEMAERLMKSIRGQALKPELMILVGGSSLIPLIARTMESIVGLPCRKWQFGREAVSLGAAWLSSDANQQQDAQPANESSKRKIPEEPQSRMQSIVYRIALTEEEMIKGCKKSLRIQSQHLVVRIPAGVVSGTKLRLPSDHTQGLGELNLVIGSLKLKNSGLKKNTNSDPDVEKRDIHGYTALMRAAARGNYEEVTRLLTLGADINARSNAGFTVFDEAKGNKRILDLLQKNTINQEAHPTTEKYENIYDNEGSTSKKNSDTRPSPMRASHSPQKVLPKKDTSGNPISSPHPTIWGSLEKALDNVSWFYIAAPIILLLKFCSSCSS